MKKTIATLTAATAILAAVSAKDAPNQYGEIAKPFEINVGAIYFLGDLNDVADFNFGFTGGVDYYLAQFQMGQGAMSFAGVRARYGSKGGLTATTYGIHYGVKFSTMAGQGNRSGDLYVKLAGGYYNTSLDPGSDKWGFGGFAGVGYDFYGSAGGTPFGVEAGFQFGPSNAGLNNQGVYGVVTFRI